MSSAVAGEPLVHSVHDITYRSFDGFDVVTKAQQSVMAETKSLRDKLHCGHHKKPSSTVTSERPVDGTLDTGNRDSGSRATETKRVHHKKSTEISRLHHKKPTATVTSEPPVDGTLDTGSRGVGSAAVETESLRKVTDRRRRKKSTSTVDSVPSVDGTVERLDTRSHGSASAISLYVKLPRTHRRKSTSRVASKPPVDGRVECLDTGTRNIGSAAVETESLRKETNSRRHRKSTSKVASVPSVDGTLDSGSRNIGSAAVETELEHVMLPRRRHKKPTSTMTSEPSVDETVECLDTHTEDTGSAAVETESQRKETSHRRHKKPTSTVTSEPQVDRTLDGGSQGIGFATTATESLYDQLNRMCRKKLGSTMTGGSPAADGQLECTGSWGIDSAAAETETLSRRPCRKVNCAETVSHVTADDASLSSKIDSWVITKKLLLDSPAKRTSPEKKTEDKEASSNAAVPAGKSRSTKKGLSLRSNKKEGVDRMDADTVSGVSAAEVEAYQLAATPQVVVTDIKREPYWDASHCAAKRPRITSAFSDSELDTDSGEETVVKEIIVIAPDEPPDHSVAGIFRSRCNRGRFKDYDRNASRLLKEYDGGQSVDVEELFDSRNMAELLDKHEVIEISDDEEWTQMPATIAALRFTLHSYVRSLFLHNCLLALFLFHKHLLIKTYSLYSHCL